MTDNFNLRTFLTENKLTKNAKLLSEAVTLNGKPVDVGSIEIEGIDTSDYPDFSDAYITYAEFEDGTPLTEDELMSLEDENYGIVGELIFDRQLYLEAEGEEEADHGHDIEQAQHNIERQYEETVKENTMTQRDKYLTRLVENALGIQPSDDDEIDFNPADAADELDYRRDQYRGNQMEEADEMVEEKPLPKYENIEKLMQEIEKSTDEEAHKFKVQEMKRVADMLEKKCTGLEEGDNAEHIDQKKLKQMKKDIMSLRKGIEKMEKLGEKKFTKKETKTEMKEGFDLRKFLVENKLTTSSRMLNENVNIEQAFTQAGINLETPVTVAINDDLGTIVEYKEFNTGREALEYVKQEMQSEYLAGELPEIHYEGDIEPSSELETQPKLEFQFEDADILIIQA
jgi:hypothetical protein